MPIKRLDPPSALIAGALVLIVLLSSYLIFSLINIKRLKTVEAILFPSTQITDITADTIVTADTTIKVTGSTKIQRAASTIPFSLKKNLDRQISPNHLSLADLKPGDLVSIVSKYGSTVISLLQTITAFNGIVTKVSDNTLTVSSLLPQTLNTIYIVNLSPETEITTPKNAQPVEITRSLIREGSRVAIYTNEDITKTTSVTAFKLDLISPITPATP